MHSEPLSQRLQNALADRGLSGVMRVCTIAILGYDPTLTPETVAQDMRMAALALLAACETLVSKVQAPKKSERP